MSTSNVVRIAEKESAGGRVVTKVASLVTLVGAHPDAIQAIYEAGKPADPGLLGDAPRGTILTTAFAPGLFLVERGIVRGLARALVPWTGKTFDHGGNSGRDIVFGQPAFRFHTFVAPSRIDARATLCFDYAHEAHANPWPIRAIKAELRAISPGVAIGPAYFMTGKTARLMAWFGLEH